VVPVLSVQPLVENAVRHGVESRPEGATIEIEGRSVGSDVQLSIRDDGAGGADPAAGHPAETEEGAVVPAAMEATGPSRPWPMRAAPSVAGS
jgi:LytS/YehU family sensor histidine kinase